MKLLTIILTLLSMNVYSQNDGEWLRSGALKLRVNSDGELANFNGNASSEWLENSNNHLFKSINLWVSATENGQLYITTVNSFKSETDYSPGPIDSLTWIGADPTEWNYVWPISRNQVNFHRNNYTNSNYTMDLAIKNWPGNGSGKFNPYLAPFIDYDGNGQYNPEAGDYPDFIGQDATFFIVNDNYNEHKASGGQPLKMEVYGMLYSLYEAPNAIFAKYYIVNRTDKNFTDVKVSLFSGFQLGNENDNYIGTLVKENMMFSYNGDDNDDNHFGTNKPIACILSLNKPFSSVSYITSDSHAYTGIPDAPQEFRNLMEGKWRNGSPILFGDDGFTSGNACKFVYPSNTDPDFINMNWVETSAPGKRSMLGNIEFSNLPSKGYLQLDFVISGLEKTTNDPYTSAKELANSLKNTYTKYNLSVRDIISENSINIKNPIAVDENFYSNTWNSFQNISIINTLGQTIISIDPKIKNELKIQQKGMYFLILHSDNQYLTKKIIVQ